jgi:hypothetical protein
MSSAVHFVPIPVKAICTAQIHSFSGMEPYERLAIAREGSKLGSATAAARRFHWNENTYRSHENGTRDLSKKAAEKYAKAFKVSVGWLLYGEGGEDAAGKAHETVPLVGYVGAGAEAHHFAESQGPFGEVPAPHGAGGDTVAVEVRGESLGSLFDRWLVFYDDVRHPVTSDLIGKLCVVGLTDGRVLVKKIKRGQRRGRFDLLSNVEQPIYDVTIDWAARVINMAPQ